jgi:mannose PTS system EIIA component
MSSGTQSIVLESFAFKRGVPRDVDMVFDARCLPNPLLGTRAAPRTGLDPEVQQFLQAANGSMPWPRMCKGFVERWLPALFEGQRSLFTVAIGCTGGQHRSVYLVDRPGQSAARTGSGGGCFTPGDGPMTGIVLVTHAGLGESLRHQAEVILGRMVQLTTVSISYGADPDSALVELVGALAISADVDGAVVLTDLPGATPHNLAVRAADRHAPDAGGLRPEPADAAQSHQSQCRPAAELAALASLGGHQGITHS